jgi:archaeal cell division control protein 6
MGFFKDMVDSRDSIFHNEQALDPEFVPKMLPYREQVQKDIAACIMPLLQGRNGRNALIYGQPGLGKTAAIKWIFRDLEEESSDVYAVYVNCWQKNTTYQIFVDICEQLGYNFTQNKKTEELFKVIKNIVNKKSAVFCFDEIDKVVDYDFLYAILSDIYKRSVFVITNYKDWLDKLEHRVRSRLLPEFFEFKSYNLAETHGILKERCDYAFVPGVWNDQAFSQIAQRSSELKDVRIGLYLLRQAGIVAENNSAKSISSDHVGVALGKADSFMIHDPALLDKDMQVALDVIKENSGAKIGELYRLYHEKGGKSSYKTFQRKIAKLDQKDLISTQKVTDQEGNTTLVSFGKEKKLTEY